MKTSFIKKAVFTVIVLMACMCGNLNAQQANTAIIKGFIYDKASGEPMIFTNVILQGTKTTAVQTDVNGYFTFTQLHPGSYVLLCTVIGYDTARATITLKAGEVVSKKMFLGQFSKELKDVEISARKTDKITRIGAGSMTVTPREMKMLPSAGGEPDIAQYLQVVPGVVFTGDQGGQLYIRGGSPAQTGILLDGITVYNPFHSIGLYSVFETDAIRNVEVQTAGFNAQYGNRTSAILDIHTKDGNQNRISGKLSASPIMVRGMIEGPIAKAKKEGAASTTFLLSYKHSYLDKTSKSIYGGFGEPFTNGLPYKFDDLYGKVTFNGDNGSKLNLFGFNFDDKATVLKPKSDTSLADLHWNALGAGLTFVVTPSGSSSLINGRFAYSKYTIDYTSYTYPGTGNTISVPRGSGIDGFEGAIDFTNFFPGHSQFKYGLEVSGLHTYVKTSSLLGVTDSFDRRNTLASVYLMFRKNFNEKFILEPGVRLQYYASLNRFSPEPRIGMKYNITKDVRVKAAAGVYTQNIISTKSDRDIVNFFTGFLLSPDQEIRNSDSQIVKSNLQTAVHLIGGIEVDIQDVELNLEPWVKYFTQNIELSRIKVTSNDANFVAGNGKAYGVDLSARYSKNRWYLWGVVSYQQVTYETSVIKDGKIYSIPNSTTFQYTVEKQTYPPPFDRRININLLASYTLGKERDWEISGRFNYGSAFPFTQTQGFYENLSYTSNGIGTNLSQQNGMPGTMYASTINGGRLSDYHRLDLSIKKKFTLSKYSYLESTFSVTNVYNRSNIFYIDRQDNVKVHQLPIFPSINVNWNF